MRACMIDYNSQKIQVDMTPLKRCLQVLNQRIKDIMCLRAQQGFADPTPTLVDLERTHILYVNAHFKPFNR